MAIARSSKRTNGASGKRAAAPKTRIRNSSAKKSVSSKTDGIQKSADRRASAPKTRIRKGADKKSISPNTENLHKNTERKVIGRKRTSRETPKTGHESELIRLNKYLASTGICSRREADELITAGLVSINGKLITELGVKVSPGDQVKYNGETLREEKKVYILLNKPKDYVTTVEDPHAKKTVLDLVKGACKERIYPVGRLDRNTTGVLLLTNDGDITKRLTHPRFEKLKIYHVYLNKNIKPGDMEKISTGITLEDGFIKADKVSYADPVDKTQVGIEIHSGRNHIVRRIFEHLEYEIVKLDRVYFAGLTKKNLHRGEWRFLSEKEISMLKMNAFK
jgi:23S rRNA pseudouridine2605 synthase